MDVTKVDISPNSFYANGGRKALINGGADLSYRSGYEIDIITGGEEQKTFLQLLDRISLQGEQQIGEPKITNSDIVKYKKWGGYFSSGDDDSDEEIDDNIGDEIDGDETSDDETSEPADNIPGDIQIPKDEKVQLGGDFSLIPLLESDDDNDDDLFE